MERDRLSRRARTSVGGFVLTTAVLLAVLLATVLNLDREAIESRAITNGELLGATVLEALVVPALVPEDLTGPVDDARREEVRAALADRLRRTPFETIKVFAADGTVVVADEPADVGTDGSASTEVRTAMAGGVATDLELPETTDHVGAAASEAMLEVFLPLRLGADDTVDGVAELYLPFGETLAQVEADVQELARILAAALLVLWLALSVLIVARFREEARTRWLADHDTLTGLPNRHGFERRLHAALDDGLAPAVLLVDLDGFKAVNDTYGHDAGDLLLVRLGRRWEAAMRADDVVARIGGDEFAVLVHRPDASALDRVVERLRRAGSDPVRVREDVEVVVSVSVGATVGTPAPSGPEELLRQADLALYRAKRLHLGHAVYDPERDDHDQGRLQLLADLRRALRGDELVLHHQPKVDVATGRVVGLEALVRWEHPTLGRLSPDRFVPLAEQSGLASELTAVVLRSALDQLRGWRERWPDLHVAVNLSTRDLLVDGLVELVRDELDRTGLPPSALELEVTETAAMVDPERSAARLRQLAALGVRIAVDDYGTGHATLGYLARLPIDVLKIDRSFVLGHDEPANRAIVASTVDLGHRLGLAVVAEGVEDAETLEELRRNGCDVAQGYHLARPTPADEVTALLAGMEREAGAAATVGALEAPLGG